MKKKRTSSTKPIDMNAPFAEMKLAWRIFKEHFKPFLGVFFLTIVGTLFLMVFLSMLIIRILYVGLEVEFNDQQFTMIITYLVQMPATMIQLSLIGSGWGLAYDIMASGDEFTQFKNAFTYFRKNWWRYIIIATIGAPNLFLSFNKIYPILPGLANDSMSTFLIYIAVDLLTYVWEMAVMMTFPSVTAHNNLGFAIRENVELVKHHFKHIFKSIAQLYIFLLPFTLYMEWFFYVSINEIYSIDTLFAINWSILIISLTIFPVSAALKPLIGTQLYLSISKAPHPESGKNKIGIDPSSLHR